MRKYCSTFRSSTRSQNRENSLSPQIRNVHLLKLFS